MIHISMIKCCLFTTVIYVVYFVIERKLHSTYSISNEIEWKRTSPWVYIEALYQTSEPEVHRFGKEQTQIHIEILPCNKLLRTIVTGSLAMFPSPYFNAHFEVLHEKRVMEMPKKKNPLIHKKVFMLAWGGFWLVRKRVNVNNGRWTRILQINSSKSIKRVMWLCAMGRQNLTNQRTDLIPQHLTCYDYSEMSKQNLSSKYFCIIAHQKCLTWLHSQTAASTSESNDRIHCASSALSEVQVFSSFSYFS